MSGRRGTKAALGAALLLLAACASQAPRLGAPVRIEAFCGSKEARMTGLKSVISSTDDTILDDRPTARDVQRALLAGDGVRVSWNDQLLALPRASQELGETDGYARVRQAAVPVAPEGAQSRHIYLLVRDHGAQRWITLRAFDVQDVCVEGKRES